MQDQVPNHKAFWLKNPCGSVDKRPRPHTAVSDVSVHPVAAFRANSPQIGLMEKLCLHKEPCRAAGAGKGKPGSCPIPTASLDLPPWLELSDRGQTAPGNSPNLPCCPFAFQTFREVWLCCSNPSRV